MTGQELIAYQLADSGYQLEQVFNGIDETTADDKVAPHAMSPRETVAHLIECCHAFNTQAQGVTYDWGSFQVEDKSWSHLMDVFRTKREESLRLAASDEDRIHKLASAFLVLHETYHVGQMALLRLHKTEGWDPYSIYNH
jgi:hypothetical protein